MEKIINKLINSSVEGSDVYHHNGHTWLIFTESKEWVIDLTENKTLLYNYNFFRNLFDYVSMDVVDNQHYITKWVEDNIINGVKQTKSIDLNLLSNHICEEVIENGVKENGKIG